MTATPRQIFANILSEVSEQGNAHEFGAKFKDGGKQQPRTRPLALASIVIGLSVDCLLPCARIHSPRPQYHYSQKETYTLSGVGFNFKKDICVCGAADIRVQLHLLAGGMARFVSVESYEHTWAAHVGKAVADSISGGAGASLLRMPKDTYGAGLGCFVFFTCVLQSADIMALVLSLDLPPRPCERQALRGRKGWSRRMPRPGAGSDSCRVCCAMSQR